MFPRIPAIASLALGLALCLGAHGAMASSLTTSATLSDLSLTVIDLAPDDGVSAAYTLLTSASRSEVASGPWWRDYTVDVDNNDGPGWVPTYQSRAQGSDHATASTGGWGDLQAGVSVSGEGTSGAFRYANTEQLATFTLSPHTRITFSAWAGVNYSADWTAANPGYGWAEVHIQMYSPSAGANGFYESLFSEPGAGGVEEEVVFSLENNTDAVAQFSLRAATAVLGSIDVAPVPEPGTYAMFGVGALLVGTLARRRSARQRRPV